MLCKLELNFWKYLSKCQVNLGRKCSYEFAHAHFCITTISCFLHTLHWFMSKINLLDDEASVKKAISCKKPREWYINALSFMACWRFDPFGKSVKFQEIPAKKTLLEGLRFLSRKWTMKKCTIFKVFLPHPVCACVIIVSFSNYLMVLDSALLSLISC